MNIIQIISEHKKIKQHPMASHHTPAPLARGYKRVEVIVEVNGIKSTRHLDIKN